MGRQIKVMRDYSSGTIIKGKREKPMKEALMKKG